MSERALSSKTNTCSSSLSTLKQTRLIVPPSDVLNTLHPRAIACWYTSVNDFGTGAPFATSQSASTCGSLSWRCNGIALWMNWAREKIDYTGIASHAELGMKHDSTKSSLPEFCFRMNACQANLYTLLDGSRWSFGSTAWNSTILGPKGNRIDKFPCWPDTNLGTWRFRCVLTVSIPFPAPRLTKMHTAKVVCETQEKCRVIYTRRTTPVFIPLKLEFFYESPNYLSALEIWSTLISFNAWSG